MLNEKFKQSIEDIINQLEEDKKSVQKKLNSNLDRISEINVSLKSLLDKEEYDTSIFSPRNIENLYSEQINNYTKERSILDEENRVYYGKINKISKSLGELYNFQSNNRTYRIWW